jgi:glutaminyl-peptide cyclotransferase
MRKPFPFLLKKRFMISLIIFSMFFAFLGCTMIKSNGELIKENISKQLSFGTRLPGSEASKLTAEFLKEDLETVGWSVNFQEFNFDGVLLRNVIAKNSSTPPELIIGAHYDSRQFSDQDPDGSKQKLPVPGAIDGASGSALLLELGKYIFDKDISIWIVFFDGEDQGNINNWEWSVGSEYFVTHLMEKPKQVVILDMLGDGDLKVFKENNSDVKITDQIWTTAKKLSYDDSFINENKHSMIDDHLPFINNGIPAALLIDFDYPYWHTTSDSLDKVSTQNLEIIFNVMREWIDSL